MIDKTRPQGMYNLLSRIAALALWGGIVGHVSANDARAEARVSFDDLTAKVATITTEFFRAVQFPNSEEARGLPLRLRELVSKLRALPNPPVLPAAGGAERDRSIAFLHIAEARLYGASADLGNLSTGIDYNHERLELTSQALNEIASARRWLEQALTPTDPDYSEAMRSAIEASEISDHLNALAATAHSIIWSVNSNPQAKAAAAEAWARLSGNYRRNYYPPAPEVMAALGLTPPPTVAGAMTPIAWVGISLLAVGLISSFFVSRTNLFQQWAVRVIFAVGAAMAGTVITGLLDIDLPKWGIVTGGALSIIVLIYLFNPPSLKKPRSR